MKYKAIGSVVLLAAIAIFVSTPQAVLAQNGSHAADANDPVAVYKEAGIDAQQESTIRKMAQDYDQESAVKIKALASLLQELKTLAYKPVLDGKALLAKQDQVNKLESEMGMDRIQLVIKTRSILTPGQNQKLATILQNRVREEEQQPRLK